MPGEHVSDLEALFADERVRRDDRPILPPTGVFDEDRQHRMHEQIEKYVRARGLSDDAIGQATGIDGAEVRALLDCGTMPVERRCELYRCLDAWIDRDMRAREAVRPTAFVLTKVAKRLQNLANLLLQRSDNGLADGPAGVGKSYAARAIAAHIPTVVYLLLTAQSRSVSGLRSALSQAIQQRRRAKLSDCAIADRLRAPQGVNTRSLIILDHAHLARDTAVEFVLHVQELSGCSVLFLGTRDFRRRVADDADPLYGQLSSRIGPRVDLAPELSQPGRGGLGKLLFTADEVRQALSPGKLRIHPAALDELADIANHYIGFLRRAVRVFDWAAAAARKRQSGIVDLADVRAARRWIEGEAEERSMVPAAERKAATA